MENSDSDITVSVWTVTEQIAMKVAGLKSRFSGFLKFHTTTDKKVVFYTTDTCVESAITASYNLPVPAIKTIEQIKQM